MSKVKSSEEAMIPGDKNMQAKGRPDKKQPSVASESAGIMSAPKDSGEHGMGGVHKGSDSHLGNSGMSAAVKQLNMETERGGHIPSVGGHSAGMHSGRRDE